MKIKISVTLTGEIAKEFRKLSKKIYGKGKLANSKLLKDAARAMVASEGVVVFPSAIPIVLEKSITVKEKLLIPSLEEPKEIKVNPEIFEITKELKGGESAGSKLFLKMKEMVVE